MSIQSIAIPSTATRTSPKPHTVYQVQISTPVRTWDVYRRYSDFESLAAELKSETGKDVQGEGLPPKHPWSLRRSVDDAKLIEDRRVALEAYLRHILSHKDRAWRVSHAFLDFLGAPPVPSASQQESAASSSSSHPAAPQSFNSPSWLAEQATLVSLSRSIRSTLSRRDTLLAAGNTSGGHTAGVQAKKDLAVLVTRLSGLAKGLEEINRTERIGDGEMRRRGEMVGRLQDDCLSLGKQAATARQASTSTVKSSFFEDAPPSAQRSALLGIPSGTREPPTVRTFGAIPPGKETEETRPLDSGGLMFLQQNKINDQDSMLKQLSTILQRQKFIGEAIGQEIAEQNELLDKLDSEVDSTSGKLGRAKRQMNKLN